jgi:hypothetical protein
MLIYQGVTSSIFSMAGELTGRNKNIDGSVLQQLDNLGIS